MAIRHVRKPASTAIKSGFLPQLTIGLVASLAAALSAHALEIQTHVEKVDRSGAIELALPEGSMVAIGDTVTVSLSKGDMSGTPNQVVWTVKALNGNTIVAIPETKPASLPKTGFAALIDTKANQPSAAKPNEGNADLQMAPATDDLPTATKSETMEKPADPATMGDAVDQPTEPALAKADMKEDKPSEKVPSETSKAETSAAKVDVSENPSASEPKEPAALMKKAETDPAPTKPMAPKPEVAKTPASSEAPEAPAGKLGLKGMIPDTAMEPAAPMDVEMADAKGNPSDIHECDRRAAHPFDPDAKLDGITYANLKADQVIEACQQAIDQFPDEARFYAQLTRGLHKAGKLQEAFEATRKGAELGSGHSMAFLAVMFQQGQAVPKDLAVALNWFEKAAEKGNPAAMVFAASMHRDGTATPQNYSKAAAYYQQAADLDVAEAMTSLAIFLDRGQGVEKDADEAARYLLKALQADDVEARKLLYEVPGAISMETRKQIQSRLKSENFYRGPIDGDFGTGTKNAMTMFRRAR